MRFRACVALAALMATAVSAAPALAGSPVKGNPADGMTAPPIDDYRYDHARGCVRKPAKGALALQEWLERNSRGSAWGIMRCERLSKQNFSLHAEGRALDWHLSVHDTNDRRAARKLISLLLAPDLLGNPHALARRMGIQEIIWDCRSWWSGSAGMEPYSLCVDEKGRPRKGVNDTLAHRDHVHFGLSRAGARMRTSFWRR